MILQNNKLQFIVIAKISVRFIYLLAVFPVIVVPLQQTPRGETSQKQK